MTSDDMYSLLQTLIQWEREAMTPRECLDDKANQIFKLCRSNPEARAYRRVIEKIQNGRINQRPHVSQWNPVV